MRKSYRMTIDGRETAVSLDGEVLKAGEVEMVPVRAFMDMRRANPFWMVLAVVTATMIVGSFIAVLVYNIILSSIIGVGAFSLCVFLYLLLNKRQQVLVIEGERNRPIVAEGAPEQLSELHYRLAKLTLPRSENGTRDERPNSGIRAGTVRGSELFKEEELAQVKKELGKRLAKEKRIVSQICPQCQGNELYYEGGLFGGYVYHCKKCDYVGAFVIEKEIRID